MSELKNLVPPPELCQKIPAGEFEDSVLVWGYSCDKRNTEPFVDERDCVEHCRRNMVNAPPMFPAPTLEEILDALPKDDAYDDLHMNYVEGSVKLHGWHIYYIGDRKRHCYDKSAVTAALKLWLKMKGIDYE